MYSELIYNIIFLSKNIVYFYRGNSYSTAITIGHCLNSKKLDKNDINLRLKDNQDKFWQTNADGYVINKSVSYRQFKVIFSTTTPDIVVPKDVFNIINKDLKAKVNNYYGNSFNCQYRSYASDIVIDMNGKNITISADGYTDKIGDRCYLRVNPSNDNYWVLGLNFFQHYGVCFKPNEKQIQLNKIVSGEDCDEDEVMEDSDVTVNGGRTIIKNYKY